jgi:hypothetical protein
MRIFVEALVDADFVILNHQEPIPVPRQDIELCVSLYTRIHEYFTKDGSDICLGFCDGSYLRLMVSGVIDADRANVELSWAKDPSQMLNSGMTRGWVS